jgi:hypothetical protein
MKKFETLKNQLVGTSFVMVSVYLQRGLSLNILGRMKNNKIPYILGFTEEWKKSHLPTSIFDNRR